MIPIDGILMILEAAVWRKKDAYGMGVPGEIKKFVVTLWVMRHFFIVRGTPKACMDFCDPTAISSDERPYSTRSSTPRGSGPFHSNTETLL